MLLLTCMAASARAWSFVALGLGALVLCAAVSVGVWTRHVGLRRASMVVGLLGLCPLGLLGPHGGAVDPERPIQTRSVFELEPPWVGGISEGELVRLGERFGWRAQERSSLGEGGGVWTDYAQIEQEAPFDRDWSVVLDSWFVDRGHYWQAPASGEARAIMVFLHGSAGNFQAYPHWVYKHTSPRGIVTVYPSWGFGDWPTERLAKRIKAVVTKVRQEHNAPELPVFVCGLSAGSIALLRMIGRGELRPDGAIAISGAPSMFFEPWEERAAQVPLLLYHGKLDTHVRASSTRNWHARLAKYDATYRQIEDADHTLLFLRRDEIIPEAVEWLLERIPPVSKP